MITKDDLTFLKDALPFWSRLSDAQQRELSEGAIAYQFSSGSTVHGDSEECSGLFLVKSGRVRAFILSDTGKEVTLYRLFERDVCLFSASCVMRDIHFDINAEAEIDTYAILIPTLLYEKTIMESLPASNYINQLLASRMSEVMWLVEQVMFMRFDSRLALFLVEQSAIDDSNSIMLTHEGIAKHLGTAREVVSRMLKHFEGEGYVELFRGGTRIIDMDRLIAIAERKD